MSFRIALIAGGLIASFFLGFKIEQGRWDAEKVRIQNEAIAKTNQILQQQGNIAQQSNKAKDELQTRYDGIVSIYRNNSLRNSSTSAVGNPVTPVQSEGLRLSWADAEVLVGFARSCSQSELERNQVIQMYEALSK